MRTFTKRTLSFLMALVMCLSLLPGISFQASAATVDYVTGYDSEYGTIIKNWGTRGTVATFLSPNAEDFYADNNTSYSELSELSGASSTSSVPSSALYQKLRSIVTSNQSKTTSYDDTKKLFKFTDCQGSGITSDKISSFYSGTLIGPSWDGTWNREHTWPNSKGDANGAGENDIMMLRPTATSENSSRGNKAYGESGSFYNPNSESGGKYDLRGDVARIMLYVYTRWGTQNMWGSSGVIESKEILLKWMEEDPVDTWELGRNDSTESIVGTRNVYVDYPELAFLLFNEEIPADMETPSGEAAGSATNYTITAVSNNTSFGTVSLNGKKISAFPKTGYYIEGYTVTKGQATVTRDGDVFTVTPQSDCTVQINFAARTAGTYSFVENNVVVSTVDAYLGDTITLPAYASEVPEGYTFQGWVTAPVAESSEEPTTVYKVGAKYELTASVNFYSLFSCFDPNGSGSGNGLYSKYTDEIVEGDYLLISNGGAMNTTVTSSPRISYTEVTITDGSVYQPTEDLIWHIESTGDGYYTIYNAQKGVYAASTGAANKATTVTSVTDNAKWSITINSKGNHEIVNKANNASGKNDTLLRNSTYGFACYASNFNTSPTELYKLGDGAMLYTTAVGTEPTEPEVTEPEVTEPEVTEPEVTEPEVTEPEVTEPEVTEPEVTEPEVTEPEVTEPEVTEPPVSGSSATVDFTSTAHRTAYDNDAQVWSNDGLTITNNKDASSTNVADYSNPARFYKSSTVIIAYPGMTKIEINCNGSGKLYAEHITAWEDTLTAAGVAFTTTDKVITITLAEATDSLTLAPLAAQARAYTITVYGGSGTTEPTEPEVTEPTVPETEPTVPETEPTVPETEPTVPETEPTEPTPVTSATYVFADYVVDGESGGGAFTRELDETVTAAISAGWFTTEARIYKGANMVISSNVAMESIVLNIGYKTSTFNVYVSEDGETWTEYQMGIAYTTAYSDITIELPEGCQYVKLEAANAQIRLKEMTVNFAQEEIDPTEPEETEPEETEPTETEHVHDWVSYEAVDPTCDTEGNIAYQRCSECGEAQTAGENPIPLGLYGWVLAPLGHDWVEYAAVQPGCNSEGNIAYQRCSVCGAAQTAGENPTPLGLYGWILAATGEHSFVHTDAIPATCDTDGHLEFDYCTTCGCFFYEDPLMLTYQAGVVLATGHSWQFHEAVEPTCDMEGNIAYQQCENCGAAQTAGENPIPLGLYGWVLAPLGHTWVDHAAVEPTCDTEGNIAYQQCSVCGAAQTAGENPIPLGLYGWVLAPLGHNYVDGECTICQGRDPEYQADPGDVNGDGIVTNDDVVALMWFSLFPDEYPLEGDCDMNGDGIITNDDVVTLMWYSLFPEEYPLPKK